MPALLFIDSTTLIEHGSNQFFCGIEVPKLNYSWVNPLNDLPLICLFIGTGFQRGRGECVLGFLWLLVRLCSWDFYGVLSWEGCVLVYCAQICLCEPEYGLIGRTMLAHPYRVTY